MARCVTPDSTRERRPHLVVWWRVIRWLPASVMALAACGSSTDPIEPTARPGVVFTYPIAEQLDVPTGTRIVVTFSEPVTASALGSCTATTGAFCVVGPAGPVGTPTVTPDGLGVQLEGGLEPGTTYEVFVRAELAPFAENLGPGPLVRFTTRSVRARAASPTLVGVNGASPEAVDTFRPMLESSTIRLLFSEPVDPRTVSQGPGGVELVDAAGTAVPATLVASGIHAAIDPVEDLVPGARYEVRIGDQLRDLGGAPFVPTTVALTPQDSGASTPIPQTLRSRGSTDPGPAQSRAGADRNVIIIDKPLIGREVSQVLPSTVAAELGDPTALDGPIPFTIRRGHRLKLQGLDINLGGEIAANLSTGEIEIEFLTDAGGRLYRNPYQAADERPDNALAPLYVDLAMDLAIFTRDPIGNAVVAQTVLGAQATGTAIATDGVLVIEVVAALELDLLGLTAAPTNLVLELMTDPTAAVEPDTDVPILVATFPPEGAELQSLGDAIELGFSEPVDFARAQAGIRLETASGAVIPAVLESHGASLVVRPTQRISEGTAFRVVLDDIADTAGNPLAPTVPLEFQTAALDATNVPPMVAAIQPGAPCALTASSAASPGRCAGSRDTDDLYRPFTLAADDAIEIVFTQAMQASSMQLGDACRTGSVRIEQIDAQGSCTGVVPGTLIRRDRGFVFTPDAPWLPGQGYRLSLISGGNNSCGSGELCGQGGEPPSFDPLSGAEGGDGGGPDLVIDFTGAADAGATLMFADVGPIADLNGNGLVDGDEQVRDENRAGLRITGTTGNLSAARFRGPDCIPATPEVENCMYLRGSMPAQLGELEQACALPGGGSAPCIPVTLGPQAIYATSVTLTATLGVGITADTGTSVMRIREPSGGPVKGFIIAGDDGGPTMVVALDIYMDAPDMDVLLSSHDLHSKPLSLLLEGPVTFLPDGRIAIALTNVLEVPVEVNIDAPLGLGGSVQMVLPAGEMRLQLLSRPLRGVEP